MDNTNLLMLELNITDMTNLTTMMDANAQEQGGLVVILDMSISVLSVIMNLVAISAIREKESMNMFHILLANLCISNLISSVLVS